MPLSKHRKSRRVRMKIIKDKYETGVMRGVDGNLYSFVIQRNQYRRWGLNKDYNLDEKEELSKEDGKFWNWSDKMVVFILLFAVIGAVIIVVVETVFVEFVLPMFP